MNNVQVARIAHEINRAYCAAIGDNSQPAWEDAPDWQKDSAIKGVAFHLETDRTPQESHASWMKQKKEEGWTYGAFKDPENKKHPCICEYDLLPETQRVKDYLFKAVIESTRETKAAPGADS